MSQYLDPQDVDEPFDADPGSVGTRTANYNLTDLGNAERLIAEYGKDLHFHPGLGWLVWDGKRWKADLTNPRPDRVIALAGKTIRKLLSSATQLAEDENGNRKRTIAKALTFESQRALEAMVELARTQPGIPIDLDTLDADPWKLTVRNGTLDLRTGILGPHRREDLITKLAPVIYDPSATCPQWMRFLSRIMGEDQEMLAYLQTIIGYTLTGTTKEKAFFVLHGSGDNGKSTLLNVLHALLGKDYADVTQTSTLLSKSGDTKEYDLAALRGTRFVSAVETKEGMQVNTGLVKQLTGSDPVKARALFRMPFAYIPGFKIFLAVNHLPIIADLEPAMWGRVHLVPFSVSIPKPEQDQGLEDRLKKEELPGILAWAVQGGLLWKKSKGLKKPTVVLQSTKTYHESQDTVGRFLSECCVLDPKARIPVAALFDAYLKWEEGHPLGLQAFGARLRKMRLEQGKYGKERTRIWLGVRLQADKADEADSVSRSPLEEESYKRVENPVRPVCPVRPLWDGPVDLEEIERALQDVRPWGEDGVSRRERGRKGRTQRSPPLAGPGPREIPLPSVYRTCKALWDPSEPRAGSLEVQIRITY